MATPCFRAIQSWRGSSYDESCSFKGGIIFENVQLQLLIVLILVVKKEGRDSEVKFLALAFSSISFLIEGRLLNNTFLHCAVRICVVNE